MFVVIITIPRVFLFSLIGTWSGNLYCKAIDCEHFIPPTHSFVNGVQNSTVYGTVIEIACSQGFSFSGEFGSKTKFVTCGLLGVWEGLKECQVEGTHAVMFS